jgi:hypothetical protein
MLLIALARAHKDIAGDFEWMKAILGRDSPSAVLLYVDLFIEGVFGQGPHAVSAWHVGRELRPSLAVTASIYPIRSKRRSRNAAYDAKSNRSFDGSLLTSGQSQCARPCDTEIVVVCSGSRRLS